MNKSASFDPYALIGVDRYCTDLQLIKRCYLQRRHQYERNNKLFSPECTNLNKSYVYLKTLISELQKQSLSFSDRVTPRQSNDQVNHFSKNDHNHQGHQDRQGQNYGKSHYYRGSDDFGPQANAHAVNYTSSAVNQRVETHYNENYSLGKKREQDYVKVPKKIDFSKPLTGGNAVVNVDPFDADKIMSHMMESRPGSSSYEDIYRSVKDGINNPPLADPGYLNIGGFDGFNDFGGGSPIISDGTNMFVNGGMAEGSPLVSLHSIPEYDPRAEEIRRQVVPLSDGLVSQKDVDALKRLNENCIGSQSRLSKGEFDRKMNHMTEKFVHNLQDHTTENQRMMEKLKLNN